jgi:hypothetical protein
MIRELLIAAAITTAAVAAAPCAAADESHGPFPGDPPGMNYEARLSAPCDAGDRFVYGRGPGGEPLICQWVPNQWPPVYTGFWQVSYKIYGVQTPGTPCPGPQAAAQSPDGLPMLCLGAQGWVPGTLTGDGFFPAA